MALTFGGKRKPGGMGPRTPLDPLEQQLTDRIAAVLRALRNSTDVDAYVRAIQALDPDALERLLARVEMGALGARIEETLRSVVITGGSAEGQRIIRETPRVPSPFEALQYPGSVLPSGIIVPPGLAPPPDVEFQVATQRPDLFEYVDRRATEYARTRAANLVVQVDSANRLAIRRVIHESFTQPATADQTARKLRSMVGLHTRWARAVMNFDDANYRRFLKDGMTQEAARARADVLTKRYSDRLIRRRAEMIARTEIQQAQNWGRQAAWDGGSKAGYVDMASMKEWRTAPMGSQYGPPCPICTELRGTRVPYNGTFANGYEMPPAHPHCFVAGTIVGGPEVTGSTARWFEGEVVELRLSEGPALTGTPNHPILTTRGWVALGEIREGDEVIRNAALQRAAAGVSPDDDEHPARIENVADTVGSAGGVLSREVPVSGPDFHGDGAGSEVAVVRAYRLLRDDVTAEVEEPACDHGLAPAAEGALRLDGGGDPLAMVNSLSATPDGIVGGSDVGAVLLGTPLRDHEAVRFSAPSGLRSSDPQDTDDDAPAHPESLRERFHRLAPEVSLGDLFRCGVDVVTSVVRSVFAGHVYNLETVDGWYSANGIVVHNCRCTAVLIPPSRGLTGQPSQDMDSWLEQLDALDAESIAEYDRTVAKHGDPSRPGYAQLHPDSSPGSPLIGQSVGDWEDAWTTTLPTRLGDVRVVVDGVTLGRKGIVESEGTIVGPDGAEVGRWKRTFYPEDGVLYNDWLTIKPEAKGNGIATEFYKHTERVAHRAGAKRIVVSAANEGTRAWASERFGFEFQARPMGLRARHADEFTTSDEAATRRLRREADEMVDQFSGDRRYWPTPAEVLAVGAGGPTMTRTVSTWMQPDGREVTYTMGEWILSAGWEGEKSADRLTKAADGRMLRLTIEGLTTPVRKHGDPSRPGYAQLHPTGRHSVTSQKDRVANALRTGEAMGLGWPSPPEIKAAFDQAVKDADIEYDMNPAGARLFRASHDALHDEARRFAIEAGMPGDDAPHGDMSSADIYADAIVNRARMVRRQQDAYQSDEDNDVDDAGSATLLDVRKDGVVLVAVHPDTALQIVADGRIKTQFETGGSNGALDPDYRAVQETAVFDHHPASPVRTVYGYVASEDMGIDPRTAGPSQYGEARLEMVPSVRAVSSMTAGDTLGHNSTPIPMTGEIPDGDRGVHAAMGRVNIPGYSRDVNEELRYQSVDEWTQEQDNYFEAQIHADVTTSMIAKVYWPKRQYDDQWQSDAARELVEGAGIEFEEYDPDDYAY